MTSCLGNISIISLCMPSTDQMRAVCWRQQVFQGLERLPAASEQIPSTVFFSIPEQSSHAFIGILVLFSPSTLSFLSFFNAVPSGYFCSCWQAGSNGAAELAWQASGVRSSQRVQTGTDVRVLPSGTAADNWPVGGRLVADSWWVGAVIHAWLAMSAQHASVSWSGGVWLGQN